MPAKDIYYNTVSYVGWVEKTQHLDNVIALGCASLNPTYEYNKRLKLLYLT